jgi:ribosomal 50S subunit-associated protein YjgA (DUF615 family)
MKKYKYEIEISGKSEAEADSKMDALSVLGAKLTDKELQRLKHVVLHEPVKLAMAKGALGV